MLETTSQFETEHASKYLIRLCKHFAHKVEVSYDDNDAEVQFPCGPAFIKADAEKISFIVTAENQDKLEMGKSIIEKHLIGFAYKEKLERLDWQQ